MKATKLENLTIEEFYRLYRDKLYTSAKYPDSIFKIGRLDHRNKIICSLIKKGSFKSGTPILCQESLSDRGVYFIETFEEGMLNL